MTDYFFYSLFRWKVWTFWGAVFLKKILPLLFLFLFFQVGCFAIWRRLLSEAFWVLWEGERREEKERWQREKDVWRREEDVGREEERGRRRGQGRKEEEEASCFFGEEECVFSMQEEEDERRRDEKSRRREEEEGKRKK